MDEADSQLEESPLSGQHEHDGVSVTVLIYRMTGTTAWSLVVVDDTGITTIWDDPFPTDQDAYREFYLTVEREGIRTFLDDGTETLH